jgi:hypothetical protein
MFEGGVRVSISMVIKVKNLIIYLKISCGLCEMTFSLGNKEVKQKRPLFTWQQH